MEVVNRQLKIMSVATMALIAAAVTVGFVLHHGGGSAGTGDAPTPGFGYAGLYAPVTLNADNRVTLAHAHVEAERKASRPEPEVVPATPADHVGLAGEKQRSIRDGIELGLIAGRGPRLRFSSHPL